MLEAIRNRSNGPVAKFIMGLIIVPFAFAGVYSYMNVSSSNSVATVNGDEISLTEFDQAYRAQQQRWGENFDKYFNNDERLQQFRLNVLQQLINQRLSMQAIEEMGLRVSDEQLRKVIMASPEFQTSDGTFDNERYEFAVQSRGQSLQSYQFLRKQDMASSQLFNALQSSNFVLDSEVQKNIKISLQTRDISYLVIPKDYYTNQSDFTTEEGKAEIESYFELNKARFAIPEKVSIEYILLQKADPKSITIADGQIAEYYNDNISNYESPERRHLEHILITVPVDADSQTLSDAKKKVDDISKRIAAGESFETLAKTLSDDSISAEMGGDLDWIERGMMNEEFEDVAFSLSDIGSVSKPVKSNFGFHLIKLLEIDAGGPKPMEQFKKEITEVLQNQIVEDKYLDLKDSLSEQVFEESESLTLSAEEATVQLKSTGLFDRQFGIGLPRELQNEPAILDTAFSEQVLLDGLNSEAIELADDRVVFMRVKDHQESGTQAFKDVEPQIITTLTNQKASEQTESFGSALVTELRANESIDDLQTQIPTEMSASWKQQQSLDRKSTVLNSQLRDEAFKMSLHDSTSKVKGILLSTGDYAVVKLLSINEGVEPAIVVDTTDKIDTTEPGVKKETAVEQSVKAFETYNTQAEIFNYLKYLDAKASISRSISAANTIQ